MNQCLGAILTFIDDPASPKPNCYDHNDLRIMGTEQGRDARNAQSEHDEQRADARNAQSEHGEQGVQLILRLTID